MSNAKVAQAVRRNIPGGNGGAGSAFSALAVPSQREVIMCETYLLDRCGGHWLVDSTSMEGSWRPTIPTYVFTYALR